MMDDETRDALELTEDAIRRMIAEGTPAELVPRSLTISPVANLTVTGCTFIEAH